MSPRLSRRIGYKGAQTLYYAIGEQAERVGSPLTHLVTINFSLAGVAPESAVGVFGRLRSNHFTKWAKRPSQRGGRPFQPAFTYFFENERGGVAFVESGPDKPHNVHVHWAVHLPHDRAYDFELHLHAWLDRLCGGLTPAGAIDVRAVTDARGLRKYGLKGANPSWADHFGAEYEDQGVIVGGRRTGTSLNLGPSARIRLDKEQGIRRRAA